MELQYFGANCVAVNTKQARIVIDDNLSELGLKSITKPEDIVVKTSKDIPDAKVRFAADTPGEFEVSGISINGIAARSHMDKDDEKSAVIYLISVGEIRLAVVGHVFEDLSDDQQELLAGADVAIVPVGNSGYTLDGAGALKVIKQIEPKVVIPTHYADKAIKYEVAQVELAESLKTIGMEPVQTLDKYRPKPAELTDNTQLIVLNRQS